MSQPNQVQQLQTLHMAEASGAYTAICVGRLRVVVKADDDGVAVDIWPAADTADEPISGTWATYAEGETEETETVHDTAF